MSDLKKETKPLKSEKPDSQNAQYLENAQSMGQERIPQWVRPGVNPPPPTDPGKLRGVVRLQALIGNQGTQHLLQSKPYNTRGIISSLLSTQSLQRQPDADQIGSGDLALPWMHGDHSLFEVTSSGIRFLVGGLKTEESQFRTVIPAIGKQINTDNKRIKDPDMRVMTCFIVRTTSRFALWEGKPVLMLDVYDANPETTAHEMGHAIFYALEKKAESSGKGATEANNFLLKIGDIYARLENTKGPIDSEGNERTGVWIADPSEWNDGAKPEHPWSNPDEFFASAKEAYQMNPAGLKKAIQRYKKVDPAVEKPAKELLSLLDAFFKKGKLTTKALPKASAKEAQEAMKKNKGVSKVEDTVGTLPTHLYWLLNPNDRPGSH
jgi:hypothetical protein